MRKILWFLLHWSDFSIVITLNEQIGHEQRLNQLVAVCMSCVCMKPRRRPSH